MEHIEEIIKIGKQKVKEFQEIENLLTYPEIIADELYYKHLVSKQAKLNNVSKLTTLITDQIGQIKKMQSEKENADAELSQLINHEVNSLTEKVQEEVKLLQLMLLGNETNEIVLELTFNTKNQKRTEKMLLIYENYCKNHNLSFEIINFENSNNISYEIKISGINAYKLFETEVGIHKLNFEKQDVILEIIMYPYCKQENFKFNESEIKIETFRSSGAGGQHINRTNSAVRVTHLPTGISVKCQSQRNQIQNKNDAIKMLISKLSSYYNNLHSEDLTNLKQQSKSQLIKNNKIREYDFINLKATDLRLNKIVSLQPIINGELDIFNNSLNF